MEMTTSIEESLRELGEIAQDLEQCLDQSDSVQQAETEHKLIRRTLIPVSTRESEAAHRKMAEEMARKMQELKEFFEQYCASSQIAQAQVDRLLARHVLHRSQGHASGGSTNKSSAKKHPSSAGGGGDGDGDGPHRTRSKQQRRSSSSRNISSQRPPNVPPGAIAEASSPQHPRHRPFSGRDIVVIFAMLCLFGIALFGQTLALQILVTICLCVIAIVAMDQPEVAKYVWGSVPTLLKQLPNPPGDEN